MKEQEQESLREKIGRMFDEVFSEILQNEQPERFEPSKSVPQEEPVGNLVDDFPVGSIMTLTDEEGKDTQFENLDIIEYEGETYFVLLQAKDRKEEEQVVILKASYSQQNKAELVGIADDAILLRVYRIFKEKNQDRFNFGE